VVRLLHETRILIADGRTALVLRNEGDEINPNFQTVEVLRNDANPKTSELGTDRPGRAVEGMAGTRRSAVEQTDWHDVNEHRFATRVAAFVDLHFAAKKFPVILELNKDLTNSPLHEIEAHVLKAAKSSK
jgi:protein required for attachment to host cells